MKNTIFKEDNEFLEDFVSELEPLKWVYRWTESDLTKTINRYAYSTGLYELIDEFYTEN